MIQMTQWLAVESCVESSSATGDKQRLSWRQFGDKSPTVSRKNEHWICLQGIIRAKWERSSSLKEAVQCDFVVGSFVVR
jgi:hypothetical protein